MPDWLEIKRKHVKKACAMYADKKLQDKATAKNTLLLYNGNEYPAKYIRGLSYEIRKRKRLNPSKDFSGGLDTVRFFSRLGFETSYSGKAAAGKQLQNLSDLDDLEKISEFYAVLQMEYKEWAEGFKRHSQVKNWLKLKKIKCDIEEQDDFNLFDPHWNNITVPVVRKIAPVEYRELKNLVREATGGNKRSKEELDATWYWLYFIHPGRHELYYYRYHFFDDANEQYSHYSNYSERLAWFLRFEMQQLKALSTYFDNDKRRSITDYFIKGCSTKFFKHIHLHPTTMGWRRDMVRKRGLIRDNGRLTKLIKKLDYTKDTGIKKSLSDSEKMIAVSLSGRGNKIFERWFNYAECSINSGPIFRLRPGVKAKNCLKEMVLVLKRKNTNERITEDSLRKVLRKFYYIEELA
ncbi:MAG: hypothetical protein ACYS0I_18345 [Planctomycetota bacterium]|jgi:hypothetical protein